MTTNFEFSDTFDGFDATFEDQTMEEGTDNREQTDADIDNTHDSGQHQSKDRARDRDSRNRDDRDRGRDRDKWRNDHDRGRSGDGNQERDGNHSGRHRDRSGNRDRSPRHRSGDSESKSADDSYNSGDDEKSNSGSSDRFRSRDFESRSESSRMCDDKGGDKWVCNQPSRTIILRGLHLDVDEKIIGAELMLLGLAVKDIRLIRRSTGVSRGFAFVEFHNVSDAQRWMEHTQGNLLLLNQYRALMAYSVTRDRGGNRDNNLQRNDWVCIKCLGHNFKRRDYCYNCNLPRKESEKGRSSDGQEEIGMNPCNTLIFRGLDALTTEETLVTALSCARAQTIIKNIAIIRDNMGTSKGFGFVEFYSVATSSQVLDTLNRLDSALEVDGKQLLINYAKNTFNTTMAYIQQQAQAELYESAYFQQNGQYYDPITQQYYDYSQFYGQGTATVPTPGAVMKGENATNAAAAVAHAAIQQAQAVKNFQKQIQKKVLCHTKNETVTVNGVEYQVYPAPDTSTYQYEETSGFYYDPLTQLYYDANSQYYYNSTTGQYMYWDAERSTYLPAPEGTTVNKDESQESQKKDKEEKKDREKVKVAKKIAKDMEKWAKSLNAQKEAQKEGVRRVYSQLDSSECRQESAAADAGFAMLQKAKEELTVMPPPTVTKSDKSSASSKPGLVASYGGDSDSGDEDESSATVDESKLVDWAKLACLLCKRQFQSKEILSKHTQVSDLHKQNLEVLLKSKSSSSSGKIEYRDRAKERRQKYGAPEPPEPKKRKNRDVDIPVPVVFEEPTKLGIGEDNIGNKLLQKMGWNQGQGLGKTNQGRVDPIEAKRRNQMAGLGARGANVVSDVGDNYREALKKTMFARYSEME